MENYARFNGDCGNFVAVTKNSFYMYEEKLKPKHLIKHICSLFLKVTSHSILADPDVTGNDGIYSRYLTDFDLGEGRYGMTVHVDDNSGRAFSFQKERSKQFF